MLRLFCRRQSCRFPGFEPAGHRLHVGITHSLQTFSSEGGAPPAAAVSDDRHRRIGRGFFDLQFNCSATEISRAGNVTFLPFIGIAHVDEQRVAALQCCGGFLRGNFVNISLRLTPQFFESSVLYFFGGDGFPSRPQFILISQIKLEGRLGDASLPFIRNAMPLSDRARRPSARDNSRRKFQPLH